ncbi:unnamed protein product [Ranitomeya imitator]|uniref:Uncharacterized protein n=1 Tax=Ranitomeya imitator TaxID=111125 RepID=A0ABN9M4Y0_9NEOB|nr:unnamed protein product [Ranitomeya imitator]
MGDQTGVGGGREPANTEPEIEARIQKAVEFKTEGNRCYKDKKFRDAIGKYHRALLVLKGVHEDGEERKANGGAGTRLTEAQKVRVEATEIECYDSLTDDLQSSVLPVLLWDLKYDTASGARFLRFSSEGARSQFPSELLTSPLLLPSNTCYHCNPSGSLPS